MGRRPQARDGFQTSMEVVTQNIFQKTPSPRYGCTDLGNPLKGLPPFITCDWERSHSNLIFDKFILGKYTAGTLTQTNGYVRGRCRLDLGHHQPLCLDQRQPRCN